MEIPSDEIQFEASRSSGPGGQHVQKTSTKITARFNVMNSACLTDTEKRRIMDKLASRINKEQELLVHVETHRSQHRNKRVAHQLLNYLVTEALKIQKIRKKTKPSRSAIETRLKEKAKTAQKKAARKLTPDA